MLRLMPKYRALNDEGPSIHRCLDVSDVQFVALSNQSHYLDPALSAVCDPHV